MSALPPIADIRRTGLRCPLCANSVTSHRSKPGRYSITSSARSNRPVGNSTPIRSAVFRLIMARHRSHSIEFKRQVAQEFVAGETLYALAKRHDLSRQLIRVWVQKYEAGGLDEDAQAAELLQEYESKMRHWSGWLVDRLWRSSF